MDGMVDWERRQRTSAGEGSTHRCEARPWTPLSVNGKSVHCNPRTTMTTTKHTKLKYQFVFPAANLRTYHRATTHDDEKPKPRCKRRRKEELPTDLG